MNFTTEILLILATLSFIGVTIIYKPDARTLFDWSLRGLVIFGLIAFVVYNLDRVWKKLKLCFMNHRHAGAHSEGITVQKEKEKREEKQNEYSDQVHEYEERILKPREEAKYKQKLEELYRFSGPAFKGEGQKTGGSEVLPTSLRQRNVLGGREAAEHRTLPESEMVFPPEEIKKEPPKKIELPTEPSVGEGVITLAFRTQHRVIRRRFYLTDTIQLLLDYITTLGYHQKLYCLCSSYPRKCISEDPQLSLEEAGLNHGYTLNIEEKD